MNRFPYRPGDTVLVEGVVVAVEEGRPYGAVHVRFDGTTDPTHLVDGVEVIAPQVIVTPAPGVVLPTDYDGYVTLEGFYPDEEDGE